MSPRDIAASIRGRLLQRSRDRAEDFQLVLQRYAVERLLVRLESSPHRERFVLKGAMLFVVWCGETYRPTRDLDLLSYGSAGPEAIAACFSDLCLVEVPDDGLIFLPDSVRTEGIREREEYGGIRIRLQARLVSIHIDLQVDIGFGDVVVPGPQEVEFPALLDGGAPRVRAYSRESVVAEKLHAAARLGETNTRMKDFYGLFTLSRLFPFEGAPLTNAIAATFARRRTLLPASLPLHSAFFDKSAQAGQWRRYLGRNDLKSAPLDFAAVGEALREFLSSPYEALVAEIEFKLFWPLKGPWQ